MLFQRHTTGCNYPLSGVDLFQDGVTLLTATHHAGSGYEMNVTSKRDTAFAAGGLAGSLMKAADDSTMVFMTGMYRLVLEKGMSYAGAMTTMKREFHQKRNIRGTVFPGSFCVFR